MKIYILIAFLLAAVNINCEKLMNFVSFGSYYNEINKSLNETNYATQINIIILEFQFTYLDKILIKLLVYKFSDKL